jgi:hypothetical protein
MVRHGIFPVDASVELSSCFSAKDWNEVSQAAIDTALCNHVVSNSVPNLLKTGKKPYARLDFGGGLAIVLVLGERHSGVSFHKFYLLIVLLHCHCLHKCNQMPCLEAFSV